VDACTIRSAVAADEAYLVEMLYLALFVPPGGEPFPRSVLDAPAIAHYARGFGATDGDVGFVAADVTGGAIGAAWVRRLTGDDPGYGYVDDATPELTMAVVGPWRGRGVGTSLLDALVAVVPRVCLSVDERNPAIRLYRRFGFVEIARDGHSVTMLRSGAGAE
jgi:GNAT superfamily N-acetyltransferase